jgi:hypothetical protein
VETSNSRLYVTSCSKAEVTGVNIVGNRGGKLAKERSILQDKKYPAEIMAKYADPTMHIYTSANTRYAQMHHRKVGLLQVRQGLMKEGKLEQS